MLASISTRKNLRGANLMVESYQLIKLARSNE